MVVDIRNPCSSLIGRYKSLSHKCYLGIVEVSIPASIYFIFISRNSIIYFSSPLSLFLVILIYSRYLFLSLFSLTSCNFFTFPRKYRLWAQNSFLIYFLLVWLSSLKWIHFSFPFLSRSVELILITFGCLIILLICWYQSFDPPFQGKYIFMTFFWHCGRVYELICLLE